METKNTDSTNQDTTRPKKFMLARLGEGLFAIHLSSVREVIALSQISPLPNMPAYFAGVINLRGKIISAIHLNKTLKGHAIFTSSEEKRKRPCVIVTELEGQLYGAVVDDVVEVRSVHHDQIDVSLQNQDDPQQFFAGLIKLERSSIAPILNLVQCLKIAELTQSSQVA